MSNKTFKLLIILSIIAVALFFLYSCDTPRYGCSQTDHMIGYGPGGWEHGHAK
jgi:hypothetical protein